MVTATIQEIEISKSFKFTFTHAVVATHPNYRDEILSFKEAILTLTVEESPTGRWRAKRDLGVAPRLKIEIPTAVFYKNNAPTHRPAFNQKLIELGAAQVTVDDVLDHQARHDFRTVANQFWSSLS